MRNTIAGFCCLGLMACVDQPEVEHESADLIFTGSNIVTMDDSIKNPTAVAIRGEKIVWVGDRSMIDALTGDQTVVEELGERALLPGFIDAHGHFSGVLGSIDLANVASPPVGTVTDISSLQTLVKNYITENNVAAGQWVFGQGYDDSLLAETRHPNRTDLDLISSDHPIALVHVSGHLTTTNSRALTELGITAETLDPDGGHIRRVGNDKIPNGVLEESAAYPVRQLMYADTTGMAERLVRTLALYASNGITTVQDGGIPAEHFANLQAMASMGGFNLDVVAYQWLAPDANLPDAALIGSYRNRLKHGGIKLMLDGSPQGKTAFLTKPYFEPPHGQSEDYRGYPSIPAEAVKVLVKQSMAAEIPVLAHANGDAAADMLIDAVAAAKPVHDHRTVVIHAQTLREDQLDKMASLEMIPSYFSAHAFFWGDWHRDSVLGPERASRISPTQSTLKRGMEFTIHNDTPIVPPDMLRLLWATTNRETRSGKVLGEEQRISTLDALKAVTIHAAYQNFEEDNKGTITVGKQADLVILSGNPLQIAEKDLLDLQVLRTVSRGKTVFSSTSR